MFIQHLNIKYNHYFFTDPPYFLRSPQNTTVVSGQDVLLECLTDGDPMPKTKWTRVESNGREMLLDLPRFKVISGKGNN